MLWLLLLVAGAVSAATWQEIVEQAFDEMEDDLSENFAYTETRRFNDGVFIGRYDPRLPEEARWIITSIDGREPSEKEVEDFLERKNNAQADQSDDEGSSIASIVADGSLALLNETDAHWVFSFKPTAGTEEAAEFMKSVDGMGC